MVKKNCSAWEKNMFWLTNNMFWLQKNMFWLKRACYNWEKKKMAEREYVLAKKDRVLLTKNMFWLRKTCFGWEKIHSIVNKEYVLAKNTFQLRKNMLWLRKNVFWLRKNVFWLRACFEKNLNLLMFSEECNKSNGPLGIQQKICQATPPSHPNMRTAQGQPQVQICF